MKKRDQLDVLARVGIFLGLLVVLARPIFSAVATDKQMLRLPIFMYHHVTEKSSYWGRDSVSVTELESDLQTIRSMGYNTVHLSEVVAYVNGQGSLPPNPVVLTFDDGFLNYRDVVLPLLQKYHCCATVAITGAYADAAEVRQTDNPNFEYMTWEEIGSLDTSFTEIAYHSYDSHYGTTQSNGRIGMKKRKGESAEDYRYYLTDEYRKFDQKAGEHGFSVQIAAYPYGSYSPETDGILKDLGIGVTTTCESGVNLLTVGDDACLYGMKRINRPHGVDSAVFFSRYLTPIV